MVKYSTSSSKKKLTPEYFEQRELARSRAKHGGHLTIPEAGRISTRKASGIDEKIYRKGAMVQYKEELAVVHKVTPSGLYIERFKPDKTGFATPTGKTIFIENSRVEHEVYPFASDIMPMWLSPPMQMQT